MAVLIAEIFAFVVVAVLLYRYIWPLLKRMLEQRQDAVQKQVEDSEEAARMLAEAEQRLESAVAESREQAARIRDDARADSHRIREELREQAERESDRIRQRGEEQLVAQRDQIVRGLRAEIGMLSMQLAEQIVAESLSDERSRSASVDRLLDELDRMPSSDRAGTRESAPTGGGAS